MRLFAALLVGPMAAVIALVPLLNAVDAGAGIAAATLGLVAVAGGATLGYFANRLPELPQARRLAGIRHGD